MKHILTLAALAAFTLGASAQNVKEIVAEGLAAKRREIGDARNQKTGAG